MSENQKIKNRIVRMAVFSFTALAIGAGVAWWQIRNENVQVIKQSSAVQPMAGLKIGGPYELVNQDGETVTEATYTGAYKLIYFGFTYCPAICPTELQKMRAALEGLPPEVAETIQPIFVSIDPERDTVAVMKDYVSLFDPRLVGLTGTVAQIDTMKNNYRVFAAKAQSEDGNDYSMDHSSFIYLMGPGDELISMYRVSDSADFMRDDIMDKLGG